VKERPILFSGPMVRAILDGQKTQTRRIISMRDASRYKFRALTGVRAVFDLIGKVKSKGLWLPTFGIDCPYGQPGDRLWIRETADFIDRGTSSGGHAPTVVYLADNAKRPIPTEHCDDFLRPVMRPSIFMPRWASRITLEVTGVRVERVQEIAPKDCEAEGICTRASDGTELWRDDLHPPGWTHDPASIFRRLWDSINAKRGFGWDKNPWVWVIEFRRAP
jgi:hypothetical protein